MIINLVQKEHSQKCGELIPIQRNQQPPTGSWLWIHSGLFQMQCEFFSKEITVWLFTGREKHVILQRCPFGLKEFNGDKVVRDCQHTVQRGANPVSPLLPTGVFLLDLPGFQSFWVVHWSLALTGNMHEWARENSPPELSYLSHWLGWKPGIDETENEQYYPSDLIIEQRGEKQFR